MTVDPMTALRSADPAADVPAYAAHQTTALLDRITERATSPTPVGARRGRAVAAVIGATATVVAGGGVAWAVLSQPAETALKVNCAAASTRAEFDEYGGFTAVMDTLTGDPVLDCGAEYQRLEGAVPALAAYETGGVSVSVMPTDWPAPEGWRRLPAGFRSDPVRLELKQRLDDLVDGPSAGCRTADETEARVRADLQDLGRTGWRVERLDAAPRADGRTWCAVAWVDESSAQRVLIQGIEQDGQPLVGDGPSIAALLQDLRDEVASDCLALRDAERSTAEAVARAGFAPVDARLTVVPDPTAACTRVDLVPSGVVTIVLRGPGA
jgi:hypothetical protein